MGESRTSCLELLSLVNWHPESSAWTMSISHMWRHSLEQFFKQLRYLWSTGLVNNIPSVLRTNLMIVSLPVSPLGAPPPEHTERWWKGRLCATMVFVPVWMQLVIVSGRNQTPIFPKVTSSHRPRSRLSFILQLEKSHRIQLPVNWAVHSVWLSGVFSQSKTW